MPSFETLTHSLNLFKPAHFPYARFAFTIALSVGAGWAFQRLGVPLAWMLGPMTACTLAVLFGAPVAAPAVIRPPTTAMLGVMLGANFSPGLLAQAPKWGVTLALQALLLVLLAVVGHWFYLRIARLDPITAYYSAMPGGMMEMSMIGEERGGDGQTILLIHSARIMFIVATVPFLVQAIEHVQLGPQQTGALSVTDAQWQTIAWLVCTAIVGAMAGKWLRLPAAYLFGPMLASLTLHASGITDFAMPREVVIGTQVLLGCTSGCRFLGYRKRAILRVLGQSLVATCLLITVTFLFCLVGAKVSDVGLSLLLLTFAPGGMSEMSLVALALHFDVTFIIVHQLARVLLVASVAPPMHRLLGWKPAD